MRTQKNVLLRLIIPFILSLNVWATKTFEFEAYDISLNYPDDWTATIEAPWDLELKLTASMSPRLAFKFWNSSLSHEPYYGIWNEINSDKNDSTYVIDIIEYGGIEIAGHWGYYLKYTTTYNDNPYTFYGYSVWFSIPKLKKDIEIIYNAPSDYDEFSFNSDIALCDQVIKSMVVNNDVIPNRFQNSNILYSPDSSISILTPTNIKATIKKEITPNGKEFIGIDDDYDRVLGGFTIKWEDTTVTNWYAYVKGQIDIDIATAKGLNGPYAYSLIDSQYNENSAFITFYSGLVKSPSFDYHYYFNMGNKISEITILCDKYCIDVYGFYIDSLLSNIQFNSNSNIIHKSDQIGHKSTKIKYKYFKVLPQIHYKLNDILTYYNLLGKKMAPVHGYNKKSTQLLIKKQEINMRAKSIK